MGLEIWLGWPNQTVEELAYVRSPEAADAGGRAYLAFHYGEGNLLAWARAHLKGRDLYWIFGYADEKLQIVDSPSPGKGEKALFPDWNACRTRALEALDAAKAIDHSLYLVPIDKPRGEPVTFPDEGELLDFYRSERKELAAFWTKEPDVPMKSNCNRYATSLSKIQAVVWCQYWVYEAKKHPRLDIRPVLVCEGPPGIHNAYIRALEHTLHFIELGQEKEGWLFWSG